MARSEQEAEEKFYLDHFLTTLGVAPKKSVRGDDPPDIIIEVDGKRIAIEVTGYHSGREEGESYPRRPVEEEWKQIEELHLKKIDDYPDLKQVSILVTLEKLLLPPRREYDKFISELLEYVDEKKHEIGADYIDYWDFENKFPLLENYLRSVHLRSAGVNTRLGSTNLIAAWLGPTEDELGNCIHSKLATSRPSGVDESWLLLYSGCQLSQSMAIREIDKLNSYQTLNQNLSKGSYDKVYIYVYMDNDIFLWKRESG